MIYYFNISKYGNCSKFNVFYNYCLFLSGDSTSYNSKQYILFVFVLCGGKVEEGVYICTVNDKMLKGNSVTDGCRCGDPHKTQFCTIDDRNKSAEKHRGKC